MSDDQRPYCSQPALRGDALVFVTAGDLWRVTLGERVARRLTDVAGAISRPCLSPDGRLVAFAARHDGPAALHVMPAEGGEARRLVHHPSPSEPTCFSPDGERVWFASALASTTHRSLRIFSVSVEGGDLRREPLGPGNALAFSADGRRLALARGYQDPAAWKRYAGGHASVIWAGDGDPLVLARVSRGPRGEALAGFWGERIVFLSDEDGTGNLWSCRLDGSDRRQHTRHEGWYVRWPWVDSGRVAYQLGGDLHLLDLAAGTTRRLDVEVRADTPSTRRRFVDALKFLEAASPSPDGTQVLLTTRGKVFVLPAWRGPARTIGDADGVRFSHAAFMPDGASVAIAHDASGEEEVEIRPAAGPGEAKRLGRAGEGRLRALVPSPDAKWLALSEQASGLWLVPTDGGDRVRVDEAKGGPITQVAWAPDSAWLAFARPRQYRSTIHLFEVATRATHALTTPEFDDGTPLFDPAGRYLYFLSRRVYNPYADELQHDFGFPATTKPYCFVLAADRPSPFAPLPASDLGFDVKGRAGANGAGSDDAEAAPKDAAGAAAIPPVRVDLEGLAGRVVEVPVREGRYSGMFATREKLFFLRRPLQGLSTDQDSEWSESDAEAKLVSFDLATREEKVHATGVRGAALSHDGKTLLVRNDKALRLVSSAKPPQAPEVAAGRPGEATGVVDLGRIRVRVEPRAEWRQIFHEAWRQQRGHFWTENMSSVDWEAMRRLYEPLAARVRTRDELSDLLWDLQGELGTSHAYVVGGDEPARPDWKPGLLGADLEYEEATGRYRIAALHAGDPWSAPSAGPLSQPGVQARVGEYLLDIDGHEVTRRSPPWERLERAGGAVRLRLSASPDGAGARDVVVAPIRSEHACRYREWVKANSRRVDEATRGRAGYIHVPDMQVAGLAEFHRGFLWQAGRDGLVIDVRDNGGGNVSQVLLGKLRRQLVGYCKPRWSEAEPLPDNVPLGPMVALCNERTASDGDIFCQSWKQLRLGPLVGKRTWGGVVGIDRGKTLVDGGFITQPEYAFWFEDRGWDVEGTGVDPDIEVEITPMDHAAGRDPQIDRAIAELLRLMDAEGTRRRVLPPPPDRSRGRPAG